MPYGHTRLDFDESGEAYRRSQAVHAPRVAVKLLNSLLFLFEDHHARGLPMSLDNASFVSDLLQLLSLLEEVIPTADPYMPSVSFARYS